VLNYYVKDHLTPRRPWHLADKTMLPALCGAKPQGTFWAQVQPPIIPDTIGERVCLRCVRIGRLFEIRSGKMDPQWYWKQGHPRRSTWRGGAGDMHFPTLFVQPDSKMWYLNLEDEIIPLGHSAGMHPYFVCKSANAVLFGRGLTFVMESI
jgi:hypothetical protein